MRFYEFEAKGLLARAGVPVPRAKTVASAAEAEQAAAEIGGPVTLKAQVLAHDLAASGGVRPAASPSEAKGVAETLLGLEIDGQTPSRLLVEEQVAGAREFRVHVTYDATRRQGVMTATDDVTTNLDDLIDSGRTARRHFSTLVPLSDFRAKELVRDLGLGGRDLVRMTGPVARLAKLFFDRDLTVAEIGRLVQCQDGRFVAAECFLDMEEEARYLHRDLLGELGIADDDPRRPHVPTAFEIEAAKIDAEDPRGIILPVAEFDGDMGLVIGAGGGSLTTFDAVRKHGGRPFNYAAIGGNPSVGKAQRLAQLLLSQPQVSKIAVISNVVSNTRADLVARGVIKGVVEMGLVPSEVITIFRVPGAWEADAFMILEKYGIEFCDRSVSLSEAARRAVAKLQPSAS
ncbi:MAG: ATP-grasp domain-containing protein [Myxococcota bacterium]